MNQLKTDIFDKEVDENEYLTCYILSSISLESVGIKANQLKGCRA